MNRLRRQQSHRRGRARVCMDDIKTPIERPARSVLKDLIEDRYGK